MGLGDNLGLSTYFRASKGSGLDGWYPRPTTSSAIIVVDKVFNLDVISVDFTVFKCVVFVACLTLENTPIPFGFL